jgi:hypothetical protein
VTSKQKQFQGVLKRLDSRHETTRNHGERVAVCPALAHNRGNQGKAGSTPVTSTNFQGSSSSGKSQTAVRSKGQCKSMAAAPLTPRANTVGVVRAASNYRGENDPWSPSERPAGSLLSQSGIHPVGRTLLQSGKRGFDARMPGCDLLTYLAASANHFGGVVSVQRLRRAVARKELRAVKLGHRTVLFRPVDLDKWAESFAVEAMV